MSHRVRVLIATLGVYVAGCDSSVEYRVTGDRMILYPGAPVIFRGVRVGEVSSVAHRGDTAFVHVKFDPKNAMLRSGDSLATRFLGARHESALEVVRTRPNGRLLRLNESIHLGEPTLWWPAPLPTRPPPPEVFRFIPPGPARRMAPSVQITYQPSNEELKLTASPSSLVGSFTCGAAA